MAPLAVGTIHFIEQTIYKAEKALVAAKFNGVRLEAAKFDVQKDAKKPEFTAKNPTGKVPYLETDCGCIFSSNAIARYVARARADTDLYGRCFDDEGQIDTWMEFCTHEVEVPLMTWVYPVMGLMEDNAEATKDAQADIKRALQSMEAELQRRPFIACDFLTLADIVLVCALREGFARVFDPAFRKPFPKVCAWFAACSAMAQFKAVLGEVKMCERAEKPKAVLPAFAPDVRTQTAAKKAAAPKEGGATKAAAPKAAAPKAAAPKAVTLPAALSGDVDAQVKAVGDQIRTLKEKLKADGLSGKKINDHEEVKALVSKLQELKAAAPAAPAAQPAATAPAAASAGGDVESQIKEVGDAIRTLKEKLKAEGLSGKKVNDQDDVKALVAKLQGLKAEAPAAAAPKADAPASPKKSPKAAPKAAVSAPAAASPSDIEAQVKGVGDEIRTLKEKLKGEGLSGKKINEHADIQKLVEKLQELKKQLPA